MKASALAEPSASSGFRRYDVTSDSDVDAAAEKIQPASDR